MKSELLNMVLTNIRSEPQHLIMKSPPKNWCVVYRKVGDELYMKLGKWWPDKLCWMDEKLLPLPDSREYSIYEETEFTELARIEYSAYNFRE